MGADQTTQQRTQTHYQAFRLADGTEVWNRAVRFQRPMNRSIIPLERGLVVSDGDSDKGKLLLLDYDTGESLWGNKGRGIEIAGQVLDHSFAGTDLVLTSGYDSIWTNKDTAYLLYVLDTTTGSFKFEKPFEVKGRMLGTELTPQGLDLRDDARDQHLRSRHGRLAQRAGAAQQGAAGDRRRRPARLCVQLRRRLPVSLRPRDRRRRQAFAGAVRARRRRPRASARPRRRHARADGPADGRRVRARRRAALQRALSRAAQSGVAARAGVGRRRACRNGVRVGGSVRRRVRQHGRRCRARAAPAERSRRSLSQGFGDLSQRLSRSRGRLRAVRAPPLRGFGGVARLPVHDGAARGPARDARAGQQARRPRSWPRSTSVATRSPFTRSTTSAASCSTTPADSVVAGYRFSPERVEVALQ